MWALVASKNLAPFLKSWICNCSPCTLQCTSQCKQFDKQCTYPFFLNNAPDDDAPYSDHPMYLTWRWTSRCRYPPHNVHKMHPTMHLNTAPRKLMLLSNYAPDNLYSIADFFHPSDDDSRLFCVEGDEPCFEVEISSSDLDGDSINCVPDVCFKDEQDIDENNNYSLDASSFNDSCLSSLDDTTNNDTPTSLLDDRISALDETEVEFDNFCMNYVEVESDYSQEEVSTCNHGENTFTYLRHDWNLTAVTRLSRESRVTVVHDIRPFDCWTTVC